MCETSQVTRRTPAPVSLSALAKHLGLSATTVSLVLNGSPAAQSIPAKTQTRIRAAARELNYRPNFLARSLRARRTFAIGVLMPELSEGYTSLLVSGVEEFLRGAGYMYFATSHRHCPKLIESGFLSLCDRGVEGIIALDTPLDHAPPSLPIVAVSNHGRERGVTRVVLNHDAAADLGLRHLLALGHRKVAVFKGQSFSSDSEVRFKAILAKAAQLGLKIPAKHIVELEGDSPSPEPGFLAARKLLRGAAGFTALFAFNDISAMGAMRAFRDAGLSVPGDVSVIGFDDIAAAAYHTPSLTTIRQPLREMGKLAAETLLKQAAGNDGECPAALEIEPELVIRESTASPARAKSK